MKNEIHDCIEAGCDVAPDGTPLKNANGKPINQDKAQRRPTESAPTPAPAVTK